MSALDRFRRRPQGEEGVAILMALGFIAIFTTLMLAMLAIVIGQVKPTAQARKSIGSVNAASSGLQAALTTLRSATDSNGEGNRGRLLCQGSVALLTQQGGSVTVPGTRTTGSTSDLPGNFAYDVSVAYYLLNPADRDLAWLQNNAQSCPLRQVPYYAYIQSYGSGDTLVTGTAGRGDRSQFGVYQFSVPKENIAGGRLRMYGQQQCLDAGTANPAPGTKLYYRNCVAMDPATPALVQQLFVYRNDLTLFYGGNPALNLCIQASASEQPNLRPCVTGGNGNTYPYVAGQQVQEWSFNDDGHFAAAASDGNITGNCLEPTTATAGNQLLFKSCSGGTTGFQAFDPDAQVGAGKSGGNTSGVVGLPTSQYVNFLEFGRCLDITGQNVNADHLIAYPCKQAPDSSKLTFNQVWAFSGPPAGGLGTMSVTKSGTRYCLTAPTSGDRIVTKPCDSSEPANQKWNATGAVPGSPQTSYNLVSQSRNQCMSVTRVGATTFGSSDIVVEPCTGSLAQRWNSPPPPPPAGLGNIREGVVQKAAP